MKYLVSIKDNKEKNELSFVFKGSIDVKEFIMKVIESSNYIIEIQQVKWGD